MQSGDLCSRAAAADAAAVNRNGIKTILANGFSKFFIKSKLVFNNDPKSLPKNPPDCTISHNSVFDNFILTDELFSKVSGSLETCLLINNI